MKRLIVITTPYFFRGESVVLTHLFEEGMQRLHLRKPDGDADELRRLLDKVPAIHYPKIVLHDCFGLAADYGLGGVHLNKRSHQAPAGFTGTISRSCRRRTRTVPDTRLSVSQSYFPEYIERGLREWL